MITMTVEVLSDSGRQTWTDVPAMLEKRDYNPCYDEVLVPDLEHSFCPISLQLALCEYPFLGPMSNDRITVGATKYLAMGRYESQAIYDRVSN